METKAEAKPKVTVKEVLAQAPSIHDILARPFVYEAWLKKLQEAVNG